jgi:hypothetical protein
MKFPDDEFVKIVEEPSLPSDIDALRLLQMVYRGEYKASPQQMRSAIECLPFEQPKLSTVGIGYLNEQDFASRLDRAIDRSNGAKLIEGRAIELRDEPPQVDAPRLARRSVRR